MRNGSIGFLVMMAAASLSADTIRVDVGAMPRVVFTGDSQTCGRVGARDYPQMLSWEMPIRVINTGVGGTNTKHLLDEMGGGSAKIAKGEKVVRGDKVGWGAGPYPGQKTRLGKQEYVIDRIEVASHKDALVNLWIAEPAREDFEGTDFAVEPGWRVRVAERKPDYACFMYSVNDTKWTSEQFLANLKEIVKRTRAMGAQPILLSGFPLMDPAKGGSHPGLNERVTLRANELAGFCREAGVPFGNVVEALMLLDEQCTSVWVDTVHPTTDGSMAALNALRSIFRDLGLSQNPYYLRAYRSPQGLAAPGKGLVPFTTSQPDYDAQNKSDENHFDLAAIHIRDEYGLIASADGDVVESDAPVVLQFGVGDAKAIASARAEIVAPSQVGVAWFDWKRMEWRDLVHGKGKLDAALPKDSLADACHDGAIWLALAGTGTILLDYAALVLDGGLSAYKPRAVEGPILWPRQGSLSWQKEGNLIRNGDFAEANGGAPAHWQGEGSEALYLPAGVVAKGTGGFVKRQAIDLFKCPGQQWTKAVRPLDMLNIPKGADDAEGRFLIAQVVDDGTVRVRRFPKAEVGGLAFEITRTSGCPAVPGGCMVECRGESAWQTTIPRLEAGRYRLGFFYRAYDPENMKADHVPGQVVSVLVRLPSGEVLAKADAMEASYQWQRGWLEFAMPSAGAVVICAGARSDVRVNYTGFSLTRE